MNPKVDEFLSGEDKWKDELELLRGIILAHGLAEELKWGQPCYTLRGGNVLILQRFKYYCALMFCKGALLKDQDLLQRPGENSHAVRQIRFAGVEEITKNRKLLDGYIREAIDAEENGLAVEPRKDNEAIPDELRSKLDENAAFKAAFESLTPGRRRGYVLHFSAPKQSKTRVARIEKYTPLILNGKGMHDRPDEARGSAKKGSKVTRKAGEVVLLSGGNPQIAKGDGEEPVRAYIAAMPGWKQQLGKELDALIVKHVPQVRKAVKWNSPFYGVEDNGWIISFHVLTRCVKVTFFNGLALSPVPPGGTPKSGKSRWLDLHENEGLDEHQMVAWLKQAASLPGWTP